MELEPGSKEKFFYDVSVIVGDGDEERGRDLLCQICQVMNHARDKHPVFARSEIEGLWAIRNELDELENAIDNEEGAFRVHCEALDVAVTALRFVGQEYEQNRACCQ